ncbi:GntR family transcriptional regulator [Ruminococcus sp. AF14-10]|nr:GntR family transcriptional regulator [Ruminococcus sp. AF14-10]
MNNRSKNTAPLYSQVIDDIREKIENGTYKYHDRLPNEKWLCDFYQVSRSTLRKSIDELIADGFLERKSNRGVYVDYTNFNNGFDRPYSVSQELKKAGILTSTKILSFTRTDADKHLCCVFDKTNTFPVMDIFRLRYADDTPYTINNVYLPETIFPHFNPWLMEERSLYDLIENDYQLKISKTVQKVSTGLATSEQSKLLNVSSRTPLLCTTSMIYSNNRIIVYQKNFIVTDIVPYTYKISTQ